MEDFKFTADEVSAIATQKTNALRLFKASRRNFDNMNDISDKVENLLRQGLVPPIFHTLCRAEEHRLFLPNTLVSLEKGEDNTIKLSAHSVNAGIAKLETGTVGEISSFDDESYLKAFFNTDETARLYVKDSSLSSDWKFSVRDTETITDLVNACATMVGENIEVTNLKSPPDIDDSAIGDQYIVTRPLSRGVVADCFRNAQPKSIHAIVGSPGIGKSWSLIYALQQALLYENVCILLCLQKRGIGYVCIRRKNAVHVWRAKDKSIESNCDSNLFSNSSVLVLIDPREAVSGGVSFTHGRCRIIYAASNNTKHFKNYDKVTPYYKRYLGVPSAAELKIALKYMSKDVLGSSLEHQYDVICEMMERANIVGNLPRYLLTIDAFEVRQARADFTCQELDDAAIQKVLKWNGIFDTNQTHANISGCIFSINAAYDTEFASFEVGYDGEFGLDYRIQRLAIMSNKVLEKVIGTNRERILSFWAVVGSGQLGCMGSRVEDLCWQELKRNSLAHVHQMKNVGSDISNFRPGETVSVLTGVTIPELAQKIFSDNNVLCRMKENVALIDFAGPGLQVYQVTVSDDHTMVASGLEELLTTSGHCVKTKDGIALSKTAVAMPKIKFYWMIPYQKMTQWLKKRPKTKRNEPLKHILEQCVEQFVLIVGGENLAKIDGDEDETPGLKRQKT